MNRWLQRRVLEPIGHFLKQGLSPAKLALCLTLGLYLSLFPWLGTTTLLCTAAALVLRLNLAAIQLANWIAAPLQIVLIVPFIRVGERLTGHPPLALSGRQIAALFRDGFFHAIRSLGASLLDAGLGWLLLAPPAALLTYLVLHAVLTRWSPKPDGADTEETT